MGFSPPKETWAFNFRCRVKPVLGSSGCCSSLDYLWSSGFVIFRSSFLEQFDCYEVCVLAFLSIRTIVFDLAFQDDGICGFKNLEIAMLFSGFKFSAWFLNLGD